MEPEQVNKNQPNVRALASPSLDFWMLGGGSLILLPLTGLIIHLWSNTTAYILFLAVTCGNMLITFPHFAFSYLLFYPNFVTYLQNPGTTLINRLRLLVAGAVVPIALFAILAICYTSANESLLVLLVISASFLTGWHYSKQGYGALITLSVYKKVFYTAREKMILVANTYCVWIFTTTVFFSRANHSMKFYGLPLDLSVLPRSLLMPFGIISAVTTLAMLALFARKFLADRHNFPVNGMLAYIASVYIWAALFRNTTLWTALSIIPLFHSLQYLFFVWRFKTGEFTASLKEERMQTAQIMPEVKYRHLVSLVLFLLGGFLLGSVFMNFLPQKIDNLHTSLLPQGVAFFYIAAYVFFNTHHYFIDNAFWRRDNTKVQQYLFKARE